MKLNGINKSTLGKENSLKIMCSSSDNLKLIFLTKKIKDDEWNRKLTIRIFFIRLKKEQECPV